MPESKQQINNSMFNKNEGFNSFSNGSSVNIKEKNKPKVDSMEYEKKMREIAKSASLSVGKFRTLDISDASIKNRFGMSNERYPNIKATLREQREKLKFRESRLKEKKEQEVKRVYDTLRQLSDKRTKPMRRFKLKKKKNLKLNVSTEMNNSLYHKEIIQFIEQDEDLKSMKKPKSNSKQHTRNSLSIKVSSDEKVVENHFNNFIKVQKDKSLPKLLESPKNQRIEIPMPKKVSRSDLDFERKSESKQNDYGSEVKFNADGKSSIFKGEEKSEISNFTKFNFRYAGENKSDKAVYHLDSNEKDPDNLEVEGSSFVEGNEDDGTITEEDLIEEESQTLSQEKGRIEIYNVSLSENDAAIMIQDFVRSLTVYLSELKNIPEEGEQMTESSKGVSKLVQEIYESNLPLSSEMKEILKPKAVTIEERKESEVSEDRVVYTEFEIKKSNSIPFLYLSYDQERLEKLENFQNGYIDSESEYANNFQSDRKDVYRNEHVVSEHSIKKANSNSSFHSIESEESDLMARVLGKKKQNSFSKIAIINELKKEKTSILESYLDDKSEEDKDYLNKIVEKDQINKAERASMIVNADESAGVARKSRNSFEELAFENRSSEKEQQTIPFEQLSIRERESIFDQIEKEITEIVLKEVTDKLIPRKKTIEEQFSSSAPVLCDIFSIFLNRPKNLDVQIGL